MPEALAKQIATPAPEEADTPLMAQYLAIKAAHPDCLLFFRLGDFYEMFFEDAIKASRALDITLTRRGQMNGQDVPMCGVPFHAYENYLARLIRQGFHVAICEQTEDPAAARKRGGKAVVTREVVRIVTPGTVTEDTLLDSRQANILACVARAEGGLALAWIDLSSGEPWTEPSSPDALGMALARIGPSEILLSQKTAETPELFETLAPWRDVLTLQPPARFESEGAKKRVLSIYEVGDLAAFGDFSRAEVTALGALLDYVQLTQKSDLSHLRPPRPAGLFASLQMDPATRRNLELTRTLAGERRGSLLDAIDRTLTGAGSRLLSARLAAPLTDVSQIGRRLDSVSFFLVRADLRTDVRKVLSHTPDLARALSRLALGRGGPRDLAAVRDALKDAAAIRSLLLASEPPEDIRTATQNLGEHSHLEGRLSRALRPDLPLLARDGGFIAPGFSAPLDELVLWRDDSKRLIAGLQQKYARESGVATLKIRHNNVIGYYIEVTPGNADKMLAQKETFIHRQTLASASRFTTVELSELDSKIAQAEGNALALELQLFEALAKDVTDRLSDLRRAADALAELDVATALAELAAQERYVRPAVDDSLTFIVKEGRHPVVEQALRQAGTPFVGNNCDLGAAQRLWLLTGPNMAGKSTFLRQNALIAILAQAGSFVPAAAAHLGVIDRLFSRVGAADDLARGQSTFMVEMVETAAILNQAGERSLVILDEIGRGTATYDGLSIAWATLEHLHEVNRCRALFATHYHELTELAERLPSLFCATMKIREWEKEIVFLHEVAPGTADRSYGIHVARMAGLPKAVVTRAEKVLRGLEKDGGGRKTGDWLETLPLFEAIRGDSPSESGDSPIREMIRDLNPDEMSPKEALEALYRLKELEK